jgi:hypothetical protein
MVPVYAITSFLSIFNFKYAIYWSFLQGVYQVAAFISFYDLLRFSIAPTLREQKEYFQQLTPKNWVWPITWLQACTGGKESGVFRIPRHGLTWFNVGNAIISVCFILTILTRHR